MKTSSNPYTRVKKESRADCQGRESKLLANICIILLILSLLLPGAVFAGIIGSETELSTEEIEPLQFVWNIEDVYTNGMGRICEYTSIALDSFEIPHIAFDDTSDLADPYNLMYASRFGGTWNVEYADTNGKVGLFASLDIDDNNRPHISHHDGPNRDLKYTTKIGGVWSTETVDSIGSVGWFTSIVLDSKGNPHISYYDASNVSVPGSLGMVKYTTNNGSGWNNTDAFQLPWLPHTSLAFDPAENPQISTLGVHAEKNGSTWNTEVIKPPTWLDISWQPQPIAIGSDGTIHIALKGFDKLPFYYKVKKPGGPWQMEVVDPKAATGSSPSIALDSKGNPHISYRDTNGPLMHAVKVGGVWIREAVDPAIISAAWTSTVIDSNDNLHISYYDDFNGILKYAKGFPLPDLVVSDVEFNPPSPVFNGTSVTINATIQNIGVIDATNVLVSFVDLVTPIDNKTVPLIVAGNGTAYVEVSWTATPPGGRIIFVYVDPLNMILEYDESNNIAMETFIVVGAADLTLNSNDISFNISSPMSNGSAVLINATIHNLGTEDAFNVPVRFYDGIPPINLIGEDDTTDLVAYGGVGWAEINWTAAPMGIHDIYVVVDPDDDVMETNETNNIAYKTIIVSGPDYAIWNPNPTPQQKLRVGNSVSISTRIKNVGILNATVGSTIAFYNQSTPSSPFASYVVSSLDVNVVSDEYNATWSAPSTPGIYNVIIEVDCYNDLEEMNEINNTYIIEFYVVDKLEPPFITNITVVNSGKDIKVEWQASNSSMVDNYLIYGGESQTSIDLLNPLGQTPTGSGQTWWADTTALATSNEYYYVVRAFNATLGNKSITSNTVGFYKIQFDAGLNTFSLPLKPFTTQTLDWCVANIPNTTSISWLDASDSWQTYPLNPSPPQAEMGEGYVIELSGPSSFVFLGEPASMIMHKEGFGFDDVTRNDVAATVDASGNVTVSWTPITGADKYYVYISNLRDGFFTANYSSVEVIGPSYQDPYAASLAGELYYLVVPFNNTLGLGSSTYSIGVWTAEFNGNEMFGLPIKPIWGAKSADWYVDQITYCLGIVFLEDGIWKAHFKEFGEGVYDTIIEYELGYELTVYDTSLYTFIGW